MSDTSQGKVGGAAYASSIGSPTGRAVKWSTITGTSTLSPQITRSFHHYRFGESRPELRPAVT